MEKGPLNVLSGALQAGLFTYVLFQFTTKIGSAMDSAAVPDSFVAANLSQTVRTIIKGLAWLVTFIFGANFIGLTGLAIQMIVNPEATRKQLSSDYDQASEDEVMVDKMVAELKAKAKAEVAGKAAVDTPNLNNVASVKKKLQDGKAEKKPESVSTPTRIGSLFDDDINPDLL